MFSTLPTNSGCSEKHESANNARSAERHTGPPGTLPRYPLGMVTERTFTARLIHEDGRITELKAQTVAGEPPGRLDQNIFEQGRITLVEWRLRGPFVADSETYDYVKASVQIAPGERPPGGYITYAFTHQSFVEPISIAMPYNADPRQWFEARRPPGSSVEFDDPELIIKPDPR